MAFNQTEKVFNQTEKQERTYLQYIITLVKKTISLTDATVKEHVDTLAEYKEYLWSNKDIDPQEIRSMRESILTHFAIGENVIEKRNRLSKILDIPYFGRIDFQEDENNIRPVYIGIHTFYDSELKATLIYDWRAPISGMFYDYELGEASYVSPSGTIRGSISLKRQYRIRGGKMEFMIESALSVHDDILQKVLSSHADDKMKNIVSTIQREQNQVIRNKKARTLIIQGVAGSGKTSIAMHRIAYLLYAYKGEITSQDILIISPNKVFADYISNVLPELGEESVPEKSMEQILSQVLNQKYAFQNFFEQVDELLTKPTAGYIERIRYKATFDFASNLERFILYMENNYFKAVDLPITKYVTIPSEFLAEQFRRFDRYPMRKRFEPMTEYIMEVMTLQYAFKVSNAERNLLKKALKKMFAGNNDIDVYKDFLAWIGKPELFKMRKDRSLEYADLAPLAYLHLALDGDGNTHNRVKHLLIDEMQDYTPIQYKVLLKLFPCRKTVLGDASQSVNPYGSSTAEMIQKALITGEVMKLCKSYRSTFEITQFAQQIRTNAELIPIARHGEKPQLLPCNTPEEEIATIAHLIALYNKSDYKSLGIICKTEQQAKELAEPLQACGDAQSGAQSQSFGEAIHFLSSKSSAFVQGIVITSAHMAKGLEFDEVIIPQANHKNYHTEIDRSMLYVAATRAMHRLSLTYCGALFG